MKRIGILTAGGDTPALNATISGAVTRANERSVEVVGIIKGFSGLLDSRSPHVLLNPLYCTIPELDASQGGSIIGASRHYVDANHREELKQVTDRLGKMGIEGLICIGGDGTINGMQPISEFLPCVLAPKTIDNDLGLNFIDEPHDWTRDTAADGKRNGYLKAESRTSVELDELVNYATPGFATSVYVVAQSVQRLRTTAETHRRIALIEVMGRDSGYIAMGAAYGQPDMILIPESRVNLDRFVERVSALYDLQKHAVIVLGEGVLDEHGNALGAKTKSFDPAGNVIFSGAAEHLAQMLIERLGDDYFRVRRRHETAKAAVFTRKIGHTQRGGRPIRFDRFYAAQLGGQAVDLLLAEQNNYISTLQWSEKQGFQLSSLSANKLRDRWGIIHPRTVHPCFYDAERFQPSRLGKEYLLPIFNNALGMEDVELLYSELFRGGNLFQRYQSVNIDLHKRIRYLDENAPGGTRPAD